MRCPARPCPLAILFAGLALASACGSDVAAAASQTTGESANASDGTTVRLSAAPLQVAPGLYVTELAIDLSGPVENGPVQAEFTVRLPAALVVAPEPALRLTQLNVGIKGQASDDGYRIVVGNTVNGTLLPRGSFCALRLATTTPRQVGTHTVQLVDVKLTRADGSTFPESDAPLAVSVTIR